MDFISLAHISPTVVPILGMHRSGTSMFTRMLHMMGLDVGGPLQPPAEDNRRGFWENRFFQGVNMRLLQAVGCNADGLDSAATLATAAERFLDMPPDPILPTIAKYIERMFPVVAWGFKDPRTVITYPFWLQTLARLKISDIRPVVVMRSPLRCLGSLQRRGDFRGRLASGDERDAILATWRMYHQLIHAYVEEDVPIVLQEDLTCPATARNELHRVADSLGLDPARVEVALATTDPNLVTHRGPVGEASGQAAVDEIYEELLERTRQQKQGFARREATFIFDPVSEEGPRKGKYCIYVVSKDGYPHSKAFDEHALALHYAFRELGYSAPIVTHDWEIIGTPIVLGANLLPQLPDVEIPQRSILYNLEQVDRDSPWMDPRYVDLLRKYTVWDYSQANIEALERLEIRDVRLCPIGYVPQMTSIPRSSNEEQDIDVLFYGSVNERRRKVFEALQAAGVNVVALFGIYGGLRDDFIRRAKIVVNVHYYEAKVMEIVRLSHLLANEKFVVCERGWDEEAEAEFESGIAFCSYDEIVQMCLRSLQDPSRRDRIAKEGHRIFTARSQSSALAQCLPRADEPQRATG